MDPYTRSIFSGKNHIEVMRHHFPHAELLNIRKYNCILRCCHHPKPILAISIRKPPNWRRSNALTRSPFNACISLLGKNVAVDTPRQRPEITPHPVPIWLAASQTHYFAFDTRDDESSWVIRPGLLPFNPCQTQTIWDPHVLANLKKTKVDSQLYIIGNYDKHYKQKTWTNYFIHMEKPVPILETLQKPTSQAGFVMVSTYKGMGMGWPVLPADTLEGRFWNQPAEPWKVSHPATLAAKGRLSYHWLQHNSTWNTWFTTHNPITNQHLGILHGIATVGSPWAALCVPPTGNTSFQRQLLFSSLFSTCWWQKK